MRSGGSVSPDFERDLIKVFLNGHPSERQPGNLNLSFAFVEGEALLMSLQDIAVSSGSACTSASVEPSYVLKALGVPDDLARSSIRFGLGRFNTEEEVDFTIQQVVHKVQHLRSLSPEFAMAVSYQPEAQVLKLRVVLAVQALSRGAAT